MVWLPLRCAWSMSIGAGLFSEGQGIVLCIGAVGNTLCVWTKTPPNFVASGVGAWLCHTSVCFYEGLVCFLVLKYPPSSFIPSLRISEVWSTISEQCKLILECWVKSVLEFDHNGLVIIILHKVYEFLELVNVVINWVLALVPAGTFQLGEGCELFILWTELIKEGLFKCFPISEVVSLALAFRPEYNTLFAKQAAWSDLKKESTQWIRDWSFRKRSPTTVK